LKKNFLLTIWDESKTKAAYDYCQGYKQFLTSAKTERLCVKFARELAQKHGFTKLEHIGSSALDKFPVPLYSTNRERAMLMFIPGKEKFVKDCV